MICQNFSHFSFNLATLKTKDYLRVYAKKMTNLHDIYNYSQDIVYICNNQGWGIITPPNIYKTFQKSPNTMKRILLFICIALIGLNAMGQYTPVDTVNQKPILSPLYPLPSPHFAKFSTIFQITTKTITYPHSLTYIHNITHHILILHYI